MSVPRAFQILEIEVNATDEEVRQAYKDIVNVWHPDRFFGNPRLKQRAEQKLKEINLAYETVRMYLGSDEKSTSGARKAGAQASGEMNQQSRFGSEYISGSPTRTERVAEIGTSLVLDLYVYLSARVHHFLKRT